MNNRLEEIRKEKEITQEELASVLEVSRQTIS
ncbi:MAG: helix-turn-helix transcriptional regulator, partial [Clostridium sp.]